VTGPTNSQKQESSNQRPETEFTFQIFNAMHYAPCAMPPAIIDLTPETYFFLKPDT
jgi:hypothetical protein